MNRKRRNFISMMCAGASGGKTPAARSDIIQYLKGPVDPSAPTELTDIIGVLDQPQNTDVNCLSFAGVTGGGILDDRIAGTESNLEFIGAGTPPTYSAGKINCASDTVLVELKTNTNIWYVASAGTGLGIYDVNSNDLFETTEMVNTFEMKDYLEVLV